MTKLHLAANRLAAAFVAGCFNEQSLTSQALLVVSGRKTWLKSLIKRTLSRFGPARPKKRELATFLLRDKGFLRASVRPGFAISSSWPPTQFLPREERFAGLNIPRWNTVADLADWLDVPRNQFDWFADRKRLERVAAGGPLRHYRYHWISKRDGRCRLIEAPKPRLAGLQRRLLKDLFQLIPVHDAAHGFCRGRSVRTYTEPHVGRPVVLKMDLADFFPTISPSRLVGLLITLGYPEEVARTVAALCVNSTPRDVWDAFPAKDDWQQCRASQQLMRRAHFPQGAPTSPAIANLCSFRLDCRLTGLARQAGAAYTRYADDLLFSGDEEFKQRVDGFHAYVAAIAMEEGFNVNFRKTRIMAKSVRQQAAGLVLNTKQNVGRDEFDRLKAVLHQSTLHGPASQNRSAHPNFCSHLLGRINYVRQWNPQRADKLMALFALIKWE